MVITVIILPKWDSGEVGVKTNLQLKFPATITISMTSAVTPAFPSLAAAAVFCPVIGL